MRLTFIVMNHHDNSILLMERTVKRGADFEEAFEAGLRDYHEAGRLPFPGDDEEDREFNSMLGIEQCFSMIGAMTIRNNRIVWAEQED